MKFKKIINFSATLILVLVLFSSTALAADFRLPSKSGNIDLGQEENLENLYTAGNIVSINNNIKKDLVVAGNIITINGDIEDDLIVAGGTIIIKGNVGGTVRVAGGNLIIEGNIGEDLIIAGGNISISRNSIVQGDLVLGGGNVSIDGKIMGDAKLGGGQITINNEIGGEVNAKIDKLVLASQAKINGNLIYKSPKEAEMNNGAVVIGEINFTQVEAVSRDGWNKSRILGIISAWFLLKMLMFLTAGFVLFYLLKNYTDQVVKESFSKFWPSLGFGFAVLFLMPILSIILFITIIGLWLGILVLLAYILMLILSMILAPIIFGAWLIKIWKKQDMIEISWQTVVLGVVVFCFIKLIPFVGWIFGLIFILLALGSLYHQFIHQKIFKAK